MKLRDILLSLILLVLFLGTLWYVQSTPSNPQVNTGADSAKWLSQLEQREPKTTSDPVGQSVLGLGK